MRALVTGSFGFVGRHITNELDARGWHVESCDIALSPASDARIVFRGIDYRFDLVVHCAYHVGGRAAIDGEPRLLARNLELDAAMFDWAVRTGQRRVLYFSSSAAYAVEMQGRRCGRCGGSPHGPMHEDEIDLDNVSQPDANYGWAKLTGERLARCAAEAGLAVHVVRPFSGYGGDQSLDYPFPSIVRRAREGDLTVWGPPGQTRDWIHIDDVVAGALAVVDADERRPVNLCTGVGTEMGELALMVAEAAGAPVGEVTYLADKPTGVMYRVGDPARMLEHYTPKVPLEEGIVRALRS